MPTADPNDLASLERAYPLAAFEHDAALNGRTAAAESHGIRVAPAGDAPGRFEVTRATRHAGESTPDTHSLFLAPHRANEATTVPEPAPGYGGPQAVEAPRPGTARRDYEDFLAGIAEAVATARFLPPIGLDDDRLKGFRGG